MRRIPQSFEDMQERRIRFEFREGDEWFVFAVDQRVVEEYGMEEVARMAGVDYDPPTGRKDVKQRGVKVGTVPATFDPLLIKSTNFLYEPRHYDWTDKGDYWEAHRTLGPGDLESVPGFVWDRSKWE